MDLRFAPFLVEAISDYFEERELADLCDMFDVRLEWVGDGPGYMRLARRLISQPEHGNNHRLLETLVESLVTRARRSVMNTDYERRDHHREMQRRLEEIETALKNEGGLPAEINAPEDAQFTAKSKVREFLAAADTPLTIVDNYIGAGTLDCLRDVRQPIRLLTGRGDRCIENGFATTLKQFREEGFQIEVRRHKKLHDRYVLFADRAWLVGSSLKDAGRKAFNMLETIDGKAGITADVEAKWAEADPFRD